MASRNYQQFQYGLEVFPVTLYGKFIVDVNGDPLPINPAFNQGIYSIEKGDYDGLYKVTFGVKAQEQIDKYNRLLDFSYMFGSAPQMIQTATLYDDNVSQGYFIFGFGGVDWSDPANPTPMLIQPPNGIHIWFKVVLKNSTV